MKFIDKVIQVAYHRNGVGGEGFHAVIFETVNQECGGCSNGDTGWVGMDGKEVPCRNCGSMERKENRDRMLATVFEGRGQVAVYQIDKLSDPAVGIAFGENSWRGDRYEAELREAIKNNDSDGSVKVGPFAIPVERKKKKA